LQVSLILRHNPIIAHIIVPILHPRRQSGKENFKVCARTATGNWAAKGCFLTVGMS
jgi:hypothetical protein